MARIQIQEILHLIQIRLDDPEQVTMAIIDLPHNLVLQIIHRSPVPATNLRTVPGVEQRRANTETL